MPRSCVLPRRRRWRNDRGSQAARRHRRVARGSGPPLPEHPLCPGCRERLRRIASRLHAGHGEPGKTDSHTGRSPRFRLLRLSGGFVAMTVEARPHGGIGESIKRKEDGRFLRGRGNYLDDIVLPDMLHMAIVRSPHAHARILAVDTTEASAMPGVVAVVTGEL